LVVFGVRELGHALIHPHQPEEPGYKIAVAEEGGDKKAAEVVEVVSLAQMLSGASASSGERTAKKCAACHSFDKGGANKIGPNLWNVLGRKAGTHEGFGYSKAMTEFGKTWDFETLNAFVSSPKSVVPGTAMSFAGLKKAKDAANILAYLRTLSDAPLDLPAVAAKAAETAETMIESAGEAVQEAAENAAEAMPEATHE
jgi:cytochrome c